MSHILPLTAQEVEKRLLKAADIVYSATYLESEALIQVVTDTNHLIENGSELKFRAPVSCENITKLSVHYTKKDGESVSTIIRNFAFADANGNDIGEVENLFAEGAIVKVILDFVDINNIEVIGAAFVQNADTNAYLEGQFADIHTKIENVAAVQIITWDETD